MNKYCRYPVGHPTVITKDFGDIKDCFGITKVRILPPRGLYNPLLPFRSNGKLKFPLCKTCADTENQNPCTCLEEERELTGTWDVYHGMVQIKNSGHYHTSFIQYITN